MEASIERTALSVTMAILTLNPKPYSGSGSKAQLPVAAIGGLKVED